MAPPTTNEETSPIGGGPLGGGPLGGPDVSGSSASTLVPTARYTAVVQFSVGFYVGPIVMPPVRAGVKQTLTLDFGYFLPLDAELDGTPTTSVVVYSGEDNSPDDILEDGAIIVGTASLGVMGTGLENTSILAQVDCPLSSVVYDIEFICGRSDGSDQVSVTVRLPCV
jgi:hypothetical protein